LPAEAGLWFQSGTGKTNGCGRGAQTVFEDSSMTAWYWLPSPLLMWLADAFSVILIISGVCFSRGARKTNL
jgi:disulfide bond formation protein DsbB